MNAPSYKNVTSTGGSAYNAGQQNSDVNVGDLSQNNQTLCGTYNCSSGSAFCSCSDSDSDSDYVGDVCYSAVPGHFAAVTSIVAVAATSILI